MTTELKIGRHNVRITHEDRVVFPEAGLTKLDLARHYERVAPLMLPYVRDRPLALQALPRRHRGRRLLHEGRPSLLPGLGQARDRAARRAGRSPTCSPRTRRRSYI